MKSKYSVTELAVAGEKAVINAAGVMALGKPVQAFSMAGESSAFTELAKENGLSEDLRSDIDFISDKRAEDDGDLNFKVPLFIEGKRKLTAAETGTLYHSVIEHIDFERIAEINGEAEADRGASENTQNSDKIKGYIENLISDMAAKEIILDDEAAVLDSSKIAKLIASDIGKRMAKAALSGKLEREMSFTMKKIIAADDGKDSTEILVQGIIDCLFKEINADGSESYIIVDYKTNYARTEEDEAQIKEKYRGQIELYKEAVRKTKGAEVSEAYLYLISSGKALPMQ